MMGDQVTKVSRVVSTTFKSNDPVIKDLANGGYLEEESSRHRAWLTQKS